MGYVYLWRMGITSYHKVGSTFDVRMRLKIAETDIPEDLVPLRYAVVQRHKLVKDTVHASMVKYHLRKEWYYGASVDLITIFSRVVQQFGAESVPIGAVSELPEKPRKRRAQAPSGQNCPRDHPLGVQDFTGCYCPTCASEKWRYSGMRVDGQFARRHYR